MAKKKDTVPKIVPTTHDLMKEARTVIEDWLACTISDAQFHELLRDCLIPNLIRAKDDLTPKPTPIEIAAYRLGISNHRDLEDYESLSDDDVIREMLIAGWMPR
jgi:hypothetical protein